ncbi:hypothetical protein IWQ60_005963 [Tieghemiomyces parasiticus]|uniref:C2H2-type domain-containing protein n=1 Tax=Tieghemiomyces parasiticus TaxID=78921 RepID=A0A9W8DU53_9FUNG|nr:hypothetical protein IWQ60_005963 [Tieghemiomyces parasiticus]
MSTPATEPMPSFYSQPASRPRPRLLSQPLTPAPLAMTDAVLGLPSKPAPLRLPSFTDVDSVRRAPVPSSSAVSPGSIRSPRPTVHELHRTSLGFVRLPPLLSSVGKPVSSPDEPLRLPSLKDVTKSAGFSSAPTMASPPRLPLRRVTQTDMSHNRYSPDYRCHSMPPPVHFAVPLRANPVYTELTPDSQRRPTPPAGDQTYVGLTSHAYGGRKRCMSEIPASELAKDLEPQAKRVSGGKGKPRFQFAMNLTPEKCSTMPKMISPRRSPSASATSDRARASTPGPQSSAANEVVRDERPRSQSDASKVRRERREVTPPPISYAPSWRIPNLNVKIYTCSTCGKKYKNGASLVKHEAEHARLRDTQQ